MHDDPTHDNPDAADDVAIPAGASAFAALRRKRDKLAAGGREAEFDIPGYGGDLVGRFRALEFDTLRTLARQEEKSRHPRKSQHAMADLLAWSCVGLSMRAEGRLVPLEELLGDGGGPVRFDRRLVEPLGLPKAPETARDAVFATIPDDVALAAFHVEVASWMQDPDADGAEDPVGESHATV